MSRSVRSRPRWRRALPVLVVSIGAAMAAGCSDNGSDVSKLERRIEELVKELRQSRSEIQRGNERLIAMLQAHGLQGGGLTLPFEPGRIAPPASSTNMAASQAIQQATTTMSERMSAVPLTGDPDRDFLAQMIPHHEGAVDMSKVLLQGGLRPEVRRLAQEIIAHQQAEIELMKRWLAAVGSKP